MIYGKADRLQPMVRAELALMVLFDEHDGDMVHYTYIQEKLRQFLRHEAPETALDTIRYSRFCQLVDEKLYEDRVTYRIVFEQSVDISGVNKKEAVKRFNDLDLQSKEEEISFRCVKDVIEVPE